MGLGIVINSLRTSPHQFLLHIWEYEGLAQKQTPTGCCLSWRGLSSTNVFTRQLKPRSEGDYEDLASSVVALSVMALSVVALSVVALSVVALSVVASSPSATAGLCSLLLGSMD